MIYNLIRIILYPFVRFLLPLFSSKARDQLKLELSNVNHYEPDVIFHVSSEGELEQCLSLVLHLLKKHRVLIVFTSKSVHTKLESLCKQHEKLSMEALRIVSYFPFFDKSINKYKVVKAFFMVRYDFFPELIKFSQNNRSFLLNATLKNKLDSNFFESFYLKYALSSFNKIIVASEKEYQNFKSFGVHLPLFAFDLRVLRILERKNKCMDTLREKIEDSDNFFALLNSKVFKNKVILGSYWNSEFPILSLAIKKSLKEHKLILCAPHDLKDIENIKKSFNKSSIDYLVCTDKSSFKDALESLKSQNAILIFTAKGVLCELYSFFDHAYIAGGWHRSIHSVLEPFLMGNAFISCGPNTHRSTEFDLVAQLDSSRIKSYNRIHDFEIGHNTIIKKLDYEEQFRELMEFLNI